MNHPASLYRPSNQFCAPMCAGKPVVTLVVFITPIHGQSDVDATVENALDQSLQHIRLLLVAQGATDHDVARTSALAQGAARDFPKRVHTIACASSQAARCHELASKQVDTPYIAFVAAGDTAELTAYEKLAWALRTRLDVAVTAGHALRLVPGSVFSAPRVVLEHGTAGGAGQPVLPRGALLRRAAIWGFTGDGGDDAHVVAHLSTFETHIVSQPLIWYREEAAGAGIVHPVRHLAPGDTAGKALAAAPLTWENVLQVPKQQRTLMMVMPWLYRGGTEMLLLNIGRHLVRLGWKVTVLCSLESLPESIEMRPDYMGFTHDVLIMPEFVKEEQFLEFTTHIIRSRNIGVFFINNCMKGYEWLPQLSPMFPRVRFVDIVHSVMESWVGGGYPNMSVKYADHLDLTLCISNQLKRWMQHKSGGKKSRVQVTYVGVPIPPAQTHPDPVTGGGSIAMVARLSVDKRPVLAAKAIANAIRATGTADIAYGSFVGGGEKLAALKHYAQRVADSDDGTRIVVHGSTDHDGVLKVLADAQLFVLTSRVEGTPTAVAEAMAAGIPVIVGDVGATAEMVGDAAFAVIPLSEDLAQQEAAFTRAISAFLRLPREEKAEWGQRARARMQEIFDSSKTLPHIVDLLDEQWQIFRDDCVDCDGA